MIHIKKYKPWIFYPSALCDSYPENPANKIISGEHDFQLEMRITLLDTEDKNGTVFSILPHQVRSLLSRFTPTFLRDILQSSLKNASVQSTKLQMQLLTFTTSVVRSCPELQLNSTTSST
jgi:hypothetical protein